MCWEIFACLCPPCAVMAKRGLGGSCLINLILTCCAWFPGCIHACMVVQEKEVVRREVMSVNQHVTVAAQPAAAPANIIFNMPDQLRQAPYPMMSASGSPPPYPVYPDIHPTAPMYAPKPPGFV